MLLTCRCTVSGDAQADHGRRLRSTDEQAAARGAQGALPEGGSTRRGNSAAYHTGMRFVFFLEHAIMLYHHAGGYEAAARRRNHAQHRGAGDRYALILTIALSLLLL